MPEDKMQASEQIGVNIIRGGPMVEEQKIDGIYHVECFDKDGKLKWRDTIKNIVTTEGKNYALDNALQTAVTLVGPFMGLISSVSYSAVAAGDTAAQINGTNGWKEAGATNAPTYTSPRKTCAWNAASAGSKSLSAALSFAITSAGTLKGAFIVLSTGATSVIDTGTGGKLYSAGLFTGGDRIVANLDTVNVSYTATLT